MVENPGKTLCSDPGLRRVNIPQLVIVEEDASGLPVAINWTRREVIESILDRWRLDDEWWRTEPLSRFYYSVLLASGRQLLLYKDIANGGWFRS